MRFRLDRKSQGLSNYQMAGLEQPLPSWETSGVASRAIGHETTPGYTVEKLRLFKQVT